MSEHLPECTLDTQVNDWCICDRLRACEQRVKGEFYASPQEERDRRIAQKNYYEALDRARDAVAALTDDRLERPYVRVDNALAAIDALRPAPPSKASWEPGDPCPGCKQRPCVCVTVSLPNEEGR